MSQAERVPKRSRVDIEPGESRDNVAVLVPLVDRGGGDLRNILSMEVYRDPETDI